MKEFSIITKLEGDHKTASIELLVHRTEDVSHQSLAEKLQRFTPFEIGRHFRRNSEIEYYFRLAFELKMALALDNDFAQLVSQEQKPLLLQGLSFAFLQKGFHQEAKQLMLAAEGLRANVNASDVPLFSARQAQIQGPLSRELEADAKQGIEKLEAGLVDCRQIVEVDSRYLVQLNLQRDLALCYLKEQDFEQSLFVFTECWLAAQEGGFTFFSLPILNYIALVTVRFAELKQSQGLLQEAQWLFEQSSLHFQEVNIAYNHCEQLYNREYLKSMLNDCQDWASHVVHFGVFCCVQKHYSDAIKPLLAALRSRLALNLQGQLNNRIAEACEWIAKAYLGQNDMGTCRYYAERASEIYATRLQQVDQAGIERANSILKSEPRPVPVSFRGRAFFPRVLGTIPESDCSENSDDDSVVDNSDDVFERDDETVYGEGLLRLGF